MQTIKFYYSKVKQFDIGGEAEREETIFRMRNSGMNAMRDRIIQRMGKDPVHFPEIEIKVLDEQGDWIEVDDFLEAHGLMTDVGGKIGKIKVVERIFVQLPPPQQEEILEFEVHPNDPFAQSENFDLQSPVNPAYPQEIGENPQSDMNNSDPYPVEYQDSAQPASVQQDFAPPQKNEQQHVRQGFQSEQNQQDYQPEQQQAPDYQGEHFMPDVPQDYQPEHHQQDYQSAPDYQPEQHQQDYQSAPDYQPEQHQQDYQPEQQHDGTQDNEPEQHQQDYQPEQHQQDYQPEQQDYQPAPQVAPLQEHQSPQYQDYQPEQQVPQEFHQPDQQVLDSAPSFQDHQPSPAIDSSYPVAPQIHDYQHEQQVEQPPQAQEYHQVEQPNAVVPMGVQTGKDGQFSPHSENTPNTPLQQAPVEVSDIEEVSYPQDVPSSHPEVVDLPAPSEVTYQDERKPMSAEVSQDTAVNYPSVSYPQDITSSAQDSHQEVISYQEQENNFVVDHQPEEVVHQVDQVEQKAPVVIHPEDVVQYQEKQETQMAQQSQGQLFEVVHQPEVAPEVVESQQNEEIQSSEEEVKPPSTADEIEKIYQQLQAKIEEYNAPDPSTSQSPSTSSENKGDIQNYMQQHPEIKPDQQDAEGIKQSISQETDEKLTNPQWSFIELENNKHQMDQNEMIKSQVFPYPQQLAHWINEIRSKGFDLNESELRSALLQHEGNLSWPTLHQHSILVWKQ